MSVLRNKALLALLSASATLTAAQSGSGKTTRYWDCCKPSCAWSSNLGGATGPVKTCDKSDNPLTDANAQSGCNGGTAYMCSDQSPWAVSDDLAYGFAAVSAGSPSCCTCYQLTFTSGAISGKKMIVQATNTGTDVSSAQFDLAMPGGGFGMFDGCSNEWGATSDVWGAQYGGSSTNTCSQFPSALKPGCSFRWDWFMGTDNPTVDYEVVACPAEITAKSGCSPAGSAPPASSAPASPPGSAPAPPPSSAPSLPSSAPAPPPRSAPASEPASSPSGPSSTTTVAPVTGGSTAGPTGGTGSSSPISTGAVSAPGNVTGPSGYPHHPYHPHYPPQPQNPPSYVPEDEDEDDTCDNS